LRQPSRKWSCVVLSYVLWELDINYPFVVCVLGCWLWPSFRFWRSVSRYDRMFWLDIVFVSVGDGTFVVPVLGCWCSMEFGDLDWYHCCPGFGDVCVSCDLKLLSPNGLYGYGYCILRLCHCHSGGCTIWILTLYSSLANHRDRVCGNHLRLWRRWV
jgi:hypothetical protein